MSKGWKRLLLVSLLMAALILLLFAVPALAAPGGKIVTAVAKTWWGKALLFIAFIVFFPLIVYVWIKEGLAIRRARKALVELSAMNDAFRWTVINERVQNVVRQVYTAWKRADIERAMEFMTSWYWQNQKITALNEWEADGLVNVCQLNKINHIKPLFVEYREKESGDGEGTRVCFLIEVNLKDYLEEKATGRIVEGDKDDKDYESIWTMILEDGRWKLSMIEEASLSLQYAALQNDLAVAAAHLNTNFKYRGQLNM
ncbi:MAG: Tim44 domain-containing protein [Candidatus Saccharibacteria bacterium]